MSPSATISAEAENLAAALERQLRARFGAAIEGHLHICPAHRSGGSEGCVCPWRDGMQALRGYKRAQFDELAERLLQ